MGKQKGMTPLVVVVLVAVTIAGYVIYQKQFKQVTAPQQVQSTPAPIPIPESTSSAETTNWKIYTNTKYGYTLKYPNNWYVWKDVEDDWSDTQIIDDHPEDGRLYKSISIQVIKEVGPQWANTKAYFDEVYNRADKSLRFLLDETQAVNQIEKSNPKTATSAYYSIKVYAFKDNRVFVLSLLGPDEQSIQSKKKIFDQILSTFKFLPATAGDYQNLLNDIANWKTYTNDKLKFSLKYPPFYDPQETFDPQKPGSFILSSKFNFDTDKISLCKTYSEELCLLPGKNFSQEKDIQPITLDGGNAVSFFVLAKRGKQSSVVLHVVHIIKTPFEIVVTFDGRDDAYIFRQIISSFKFTQ